MTLNEVKIYPRVYIIEEIPKNLLTERLINIGCEVGKEIKVCQVSKNQIVIAIGAGLASTVSIDEAEQIKVQPR